MVSPLRGLQLISIISRKRCTEQLVMLHNISTFFLHWNTWGSSVRSGMMEVVKTWVSWQAFLLDVWKDWFFYQNSLNFQTVSCEKFFLRCFYSPQFSAAKVSAIKYLASFGRFLFTFGVEWCHDLKQSAAKHPPTHKLSLAPAKKQKFLCKQLLSTSSVFCR